MYLTLSMPKAVSRWWLFFAAFLLGLVMQDALFAQTRHHLTDGNLPPGVASERAIWSNPSFLGHLQAVKLVVPDGAKISYWEGSGYAEAATQTPIFEMTMGPVYRLKVTNIPRAAGKEIFPSVELLSRLHPPVGREAEFPIPVVITESDLNEALSGKMVTKVVYLEDPETALPFEQVSELQQRLTDVSGYEDPLHAAEGLGRPMAIVRLGSRLPLPQDTAGAFEFNSSLRLWGQANAGQLNGTVQPQLDSQTRLAPLTPSRPFAPHLINRGARPNAGSPPVVSGHNASFSMGDR